MSVFDKKARIATFVAGIALAVSLAGVPAALAGAPSRVSLTVSAKTANCIVHGLKGKCWGAVSGTGLAGADVFLYANNETTPYNTDPFVADSKGTLSVPAMIPCGSGVSTVYAAVSGGPQSDVVAAPC